jgi:DNA-binding MarR family transcriptional regulator
MPSASTNINQATPDLPLPTLLSHVLVAFTIEFDNEAEQQLPHTTTKRRRTPGGLPAPWLVSLVMYLNCMQFVPADGIRLGDLERLARTSTNLNGMQRWGYITLAPDPADTRPKPPRPDWLIRAKPGGRMAQQVWRPLLSLIEKRWQERFGKERMADLRAALSALAAHLDPNLPDCLPILHYGLFCRVQNSPKNSRPKETPPPQNSAPDQLPIIALLSRVLLSLAIDFERDSPLSLAICANVLRPLNETGVRPRDLPPLSGVSKESIAMAMGILQKGKLVTLEAAQAGKREKLIRLTAKGLAAQSAYRRLLAAIDEQWQTRFGKTAIANLRAALEALVGGATPEPSPLFRAIEPHPDGWRASVPKPSTLPHFPMVLHRGGYPDGA